MNKDEALKMAIEFMGTLTIDVGIKIWNEKRRKEAIQACKEALEQPIIRNNQTVQYLYVYMNKQTGNPVFELDKPNYIFEDDEHKYLGKIKLEVDDD